MPLHRYMEINNAARTIMFRARRPVKHGASLLICLPHVAREWLRIDETSRLDITLDINNESLHIRKGESHGVDTNDRRRGATAPDRDTTHQSVLAQAAPQEVIKEPDPATTLAELDLAAILGTPAPENPWDATTTTAEGEALQTQEAEYGTTTEGDANGENQGTDWEGDPYQNQDGLG